MVIWGCVITILFSASAPRPPAGESAFCFSTPFLKYVGTPLTSTMRAHTSNNYKVTLVESTEVEALEACNITTAYTDGLYSVLIYSGILNITVNSEEISYRPDSQSDALCFAINLCEGTTSPLSISVTKDANDLISELEFMKSFKAANWDINFHSISISNSMIPTHYKGEWS